MSSSVAKPVLVIENDVNDPVGRLGEWLTTAGVVLDVRSAPAGDAIPDEVEGFGGLIVMGGWQHAYRDSDSPWLGSVRNLLAGAVRAGLPTLGVCLGGQLLATATGGAVGPAGTPEYGAQLVAKRQAAADDALFAELPITPDVIQWHVDEITRLPAGAVLLASSPAFEVQAFRVGPRAWGLQFHIETTPAMIRSWAEQDADAMSEYDLTLILERAVAVHDDLAETWQPFAQQFARVVADPAVAAPRLGLPLAGRSNSAAPITDPADIRAALAAELQASRAPHGH